MENNCNNTIIDSEMNKDNVSNYVSELQKENNYLNKKIELQDEELSCKCEIISELQNMIINLYEQYIEGGKEKAVLDMGVKLADIYKKYIKA